MARLFDVIAEDYDRWYETYEGQAAFGAELKCLRSLCSNFQGRWLEVGVGSGRFASTLGVTSGTDPSLPMLKIAARRGVRICAGLAEDLPYAEDSFDGVLMALAICFIADPRRAVRECRRILRPQGNLLLGMIPANSPWGTAYGKKKEEGHPVYSLAKFYNIPEIVALIQNSGFAFEAAASALFWNPGGPPGNASRVETGIFPEAGFVGLLFGRRADDGERL